MLTKSLNYRRGGAERKRPGGVAAILASVLFISIASAAEEPQADPEDLPRIPATAPDKALSTFEVRPGITLDLAAHEPLVEDPISITFDEDGHLFAVEMRGYSERRDENRGQIRMLFDDDDDGTFDRSTIYAKGLAWPTGLVCSNGGIFVVATPDLIWFKDTDGDGVADEKKVVFTGFGEGVTRLNVQGLPNSLQWGPDNRIWGSAGTLGGKIRKPDQKLEEAVNISGSDFSFDPGTLDFRAENGRAQYGLSFDSTGRRFLSSNSNHIIAVMWEKGWTRPSPWYSLPRALASIATDGGSAPVFRISPDEPWRIVRTRWRVSGVVKGAVEGGGRVSGYFTGASGVTIYTGDALGAEYMDNAFTGDVGSNLVHRKIVTNQEGLVALRADRPKDEAAREFIASTDNWFRPTTYTNAPDGCFYISDMYREVIEHPWSVPEGIKKHLDLNSGTDRGRIYRVRPEKYQRRKTVQLSASTNDELAALLKHDNGWHRITAQRLLWERGDDRAGSGWARGAKPGTPDVAFRKALGLAQDKSDGKVEQLAAFLAGSPRDSWLTAAALHAIGNEKEAGDLFARLSDGGFSGKPYLLPLVQIIGKMNKPKVVELVLLTTSKNVDQPETVSILESLGTGLASARSSLAKADQNGILAPVFSGALATVADPGADAKKRIAAIRLSAFSPAKEVDSKLEKIVSTKGNDKLYISAIDSLKKRRSKSLGSLLTGNWNLYPAAVKSSVLQVLLESAPRSAQLLKAIEEDKIPKSALNPGQISLLRNSKDAGIKKQVAALYPVEKKVPRSKVVADYQSVLKQKGDPVKGKAIYATACASCHKHGDDGFAVGPDMATFKTAGNESIITNLFDPNKEVAPQYQAFVFTLKNGEQTLGVIANETTSEVTVRMAFGVEKTFPRVEVASMKALGQSLMPEGLEATMTKEALADLLAFISQG